MLELENCRLCPRNCGINRYEKLGYCQASAELMVAKVFRHQWEEPCISGEQGSGTVFFSHCNLRCVFCQNHEISQGSKGKVISTKRLAEIFLELQDQRVHNINLVTPTHYLPLIREALRLAKQKGLRLPIVYNSNAYENVDAIRSLEGLIDIYLPDIKYYKDKFSRKYSLAPLYFEKATLAILEMFRQVGKPVFNEQGLLIRGLMLRHLMLPGLLFDSKKIVDWVLDNLSPEIYLNIMSQYTPQHQVKNFPEINKKLSAEHYNALLDYALNKGLENGFMQEAESSSTEFIPNFDLEGV